MNLSNRARWGACFPCRCLIDRQRYEKMCKKTENAAKDPKSLRLDMAEIAGPNPAIANGVVSSEATTTTPATL